MAPTRYPALPVVLSDAADQCLLSTPYEQYSPLSYSRFVKGEQHRSQVLLSTAAVATACVAATAYLASHPSEASTDAFAIPVAAQSSRTVMRASKYTPGDDERPARKNQKVAEAKQRVFKGIVAAGAAASAMQANAYDLDLLSDLSTMDYEASTGTVPKGGSVALQEKLKKDIPVLERAKVKTAPEVKAEPETGLFGFFKGAESTKQTEKPGVPQKEETKKEDVKKEEISAFKAEQRKALREKALAASKAAQAPADAPKPQVANPEDLFADFLKASTDDLFEAPKKKEAEKKAPAAKVEAPAKVAAPKTEEEGSLFGFFKRAEPAKEEAKPAAPSKEEKAASKAEQLKALREKAEALATKEAPTVPIAPVAPVAPAAPKAEAGPSQDLQNLFGDFLKGAQPEEKAVEPATKAAPPPAVPDQNDPFAAFKKAAAPAPAPAKAPETAPVPAPQAKGSEEKEEGSLFGLFKKETEEKAAPPAAPAPKAPEAPKTPEAPKPKPAEPKSEDPFAAFLAAEPKVEPAAPAAPAPAPAKPEAPKAEKPKAEKPKAEKPKLAAPKQVEKPKAAAPTSAGLSITPASIGAGLAAVGAGLLGFLLTRSTPSKRLQAKKAILQAIEGTNRGFSVSEEDLGSINAAIKALEKQNPTSNPLTSPLIDGKWELLFSTSSRVLGKRSAKAIFEVIDVDAGVLKLEQEVAPLPFLRFKDTSSTLLDLKDSKKVVVMKGDNKSIKAMQKAQKERGSLRGVIGQASEAGATSVLEGFSVSYLDETWRVSRTEDGDVSVFRREGAVDELQEEDDGEVEADVEQPRRPGFFGRPQRVEDIEEEDVKPISRLPKFEAPKFGRPKPVEEDEDEEEVKPAPRPKLPSRPSWAQAPAPAPVPRRVVPEDDEEEEAKPALGFPKFEVPKFNFPKPAAAPKVEEEDEEVPAHKLAVPNPLAGFKFPELKVPEVPDMASWKLGDVMEQLQKKSALLAGREAPAEEVPALPPTEEAKQKLLKLISVTERGLVLSLQQADRIEEAVRELEALNPTPQPVKSPLLSGKWELLYTTSESILGKDKPEQLQPKGPIYQYIDTAALKASNEQTIQPVELLPPVTTSVDADLTPQTDSRLAVKFGPINLGPVKVPPTSGQEATLDITYLDDELRVSRGSRGNVFVLRMADRSQIQPVKKE